MTDRADVDENTADVQTAEQLGFDFDRFFGVGPSHDAAKHGAHESPDEAADDVIDLDSDPDLELDSDGDLDLDLDSDDDPDLELDDGPVPDEPVQIRVLDADERGMPTSDVDADSIDIVDGAAPTDAESDIDIDTAERTSDSGRSDDSDEPADLDAALELDAAIKLASERPAEWRRVRKWDRPPEPRDWRFFVGAIGRIMLATGVLMFGFVAYQLWGTGIETARAQNSLEDRFEAVLAERPADAGDTGSGDATADDSDDTTDDTSDDTTGDAIADGQDSADGSDEAATADPVDAAQGGDDGTFNPVIPDLSDDAIEQDIPDIGRGDALARLEIPKIGQDVYVVPGVNIDDLKDGPGHYPDTPLPGQLGNAAIAGHRTTYGSPFFDVDQLEPGDELRVTMLTGDQFVYEVTGIEVVEATDYWVVSTTNPDTAELTLTSCHPKYSARQRIIVRSVLNPEKSANVGFPTSYELGPGNDEPIPGDDPVVDITDPQLADTDVIEAADDAGTDDPEAPATDGGTADDPTDAETPAAPSAAPTDEDTDRDRDTEVAAGPLADTAGLAAADEFSRGWFDDSAAWPQILLWGLALIAIALAAHRVSRRFRRDLVGAAVGIVPFVVVLYFFFQNVHRLLPPGI